MPEYVVNIWKGDLKHTIVLDGKELDKLTDALVAVDGNEWIQISGILDEADRGSLFLVIRKSEITSWCYWECK